MVLHQNRKKFVVNDASETQTTKVRVNAPGVLFQTKINFPFQGKFSSRHVNIASFNEIYDILKI